MTDAAQLLTLNLEEVRRRSLIVWQAIPDERLGWRPDPESMTLGEMIRHTWESTGTYTAIATARRSVPVEDSRQPIQSVQQEMAYADPNFQQLTHFVQSLQEDDLISVVDRSDIGYKRQLGDFILRVAYHEAVHTGQLLQAMRAADIPRPDIWD